MTAGLGVRATAVEGGVAYIVADRYASRLWAILQPSLNAAADVDEDARELLRLLGRHAGRQVGCAEVARSGEAARFSRAYTRDEVADKIGRTPQWVSELKDGDLAGYWFRRPGGALVFDADAVDAYAASRGRDR